MTKDNKRLLISLGLLFLPSVLTIRFPHDSYTIIEYIFRPIRLGSNGMFYISTLILVILYLFGIYGLLHLERFKKVNKLFLFLLIVMVLIPFMNKSAASAKLCYYSLKHEMLQSIELDNANLSLSSINDKLAVTVNINLTDYSRTGNNFKYRVYLPESLSSLLGMEMIESQSYYVSGGNGSKLTISETFGITTVIQPQNIFDCQWYREDITYELYNDTDKVQLINRGV